MVARKFFVRHGDSSFHVDCDTEDGLEVLRFQIFSLTMVPPDEQKIVVEDDDRLLSDESDLASISNKLRLLSVRGNSEATTSSEKSDVEMVKSDEELARVLQISLLLQRITQVEIDLIMNLVLLQNKLDIIRLVVNISTVL
ncbi:Peptide-N(4)-(N-acetyl-beta-glucosaminyl)asparagine amidase [Cardamine amara subsp. amara]|uniref:Peptide-N(4)-(N-acetyl-beta-glucosaminyl)asparagine amidase n=1 Tax=Cardamine amara subsp. amara TaxID=228776 RepID=A0ABD0ZKI3_CARAN